MVRFYSVWRRFLAINELSEGEYIGTNDPGQVGNDRGRRCWSMVGRCDDGHAFKPLSEAFMLATVLDQCGG